MKSPVTAEEFESIVGAENIRPATAADSVAGVQPEYVVSPGSEQELAAVLAAANEAEIIVIPRGGGTKLDWGNAPTRAGIILSTLRLNRVLEHPWADLTVSVEAGCTMQYLQNTVARHGQRLALDALWPERATIGGVLSSNDSGVLRLRFGALRDLIIGVTLALPDGTLASSGGKVVKNVAGYDLPKLATGAFGTLGIITRAVFRLHPRCRQSLTLTFTTPTIEAMQDAILCLQDSHLAHVALQIGCAGGKVNQPHADVLFEATPTGLLAQKTKLQELLRAWPVEQSADDVWLAKQQRWEGENSNCAVAKITMLPSHIAESMRELERIIVPHNLLWELVLQATGIGWMRICGEPKPLKASLEQFRSYLESFGGALVLLRRPTDLEMDAWGNHGDAAVGVMRALKRQLDPKATLNPGRFVGGI